MGEGWLLSEGSSLEKEHLGTLSGDAQCYWVPLVVTLSATGGWMCPLSAGDVGRLAAASTAVRNVFLFSPYLKNIKKCRSVPLLLFKELK